LKYVIIRLLCGPPRNVPIDLKFFIFVYVSKSQDMKYGPKHLCKLFQNSHFQMHPSLHARHLASYTSDVSFQ